MMPAPVVVGYTLLIVLPTIKLIAALVSRRAWHQIGLLQSELERDPQYTERDREHIRQRVADGYGHPALMLLPLAVPIAMPVMAVTVALVGVAAHDEKDIERRMDTLRRDQERHREEMAVFGKKYNALSKSLLEDPRLGEITNLTTPLGFLRYPVATLLTVAMLILTGWMPMMTLGVHYGSKLVWRAIRDVARTNTVAPLFATRQILEV